MFRVFPWNPLSHQSLLTHTATQHIGKCKSGTDTGRPYRENSCCPHNLSEFNASDPWLVKFDWNFSLFTKCGRLNAEPALTAHPVRARTRRRECVSGTDPWMNTPLQWYWKSVAKEEEDSLMLVSHRLYVFIVCKGIATERWVLVS